MPRRPSWLGEGRIAAPGISKRREGCTLLFYPNRGIDTGTVGLITMQRVQGREAIATRMSRSAIEGQTFDAANEGISCDVSSFGELGTERAHMVCVGDDGTGAVGRCKVAN
jgi:hypothetical protein